MTQMNTERAQEKEEHIKGRAWPLLGLYESESPRGGPNSACDVGLRWKPNQQIRERPDGAQSWRCFDWPLLGTLRSLRRVINRGCGLRWK